MHKFYNLTILPSDAQLQILHTFIDMNHLADFLHFLNFFLELNVNRYLRRIFRTLLSINENMLLQLLYIVNCITEILRNIWVSVCCLVCNAVLDQKQV